MTDEKTPRGYHDMGGLPGGPVEQTEHILAPWEKRVDALTMALSAPKIGKRAFYVDERRDKIETMGEDKYESLTYYELWMASVAGVLVDKGMLTEEEIEAKMAEIRDRLGLEAESA
ncbi:MAG: nitrile hydratase subunit beta [Rhodospirillaceae bacterium]|jgi:hypothetical protein|nr:nitrile hydratase subunit beta [Rhodospirillales bacterium]MBT3905696.1 nitrile hydratase subunit beta [Rhodospirillaceae bacterium]MBT4699953.1 nitrile hydratase subunit beta [Rhodospirillaceae bacterium]MBT5034311.1 nitrile hydratase subunit beta [Rhodospirillaceae bacterium]MBT6221707.1 nitrile hydratase subunit beta [Rhodospirillaceae bacterium]